MAIVSLETFVERARLKGIKKIAVAVAEDEDVLLAIKLAQEAGLIDPILVGDQDKIKTLAERCELTKKSFEILHEPVASLACRRAVNLVREQKASLVMKGMVSTSMLLKAVLDKESGITRGGLLSHVAFFESPYYPKILCITDAAMNVSPDLQEKVQILQNAVKVFHQLGISDPKVGILAAVETVNPKMEATVHAALLKAMNQRGQINGCSIEGPLALDNAVSKESAVLKGIQSEIAGDVDILLAPEINSGNILYKSLNFLGGAVTAAFVTGATVPIVLTSRADSERSKFLSIALAAALDQ